MNYTEADDQPVNRNQFRNYAARRIDPEEAQRMLASVPVDTRNFTARVMGDPLPGRSALDRRAHAGSEGDAA